MATIELLAHTRAAQRCAPPPPLMLMCSATLRERASIAVQILQTVLAFSLVPRPSIHLFFVFFSTLHFYVLGSGKSWAGARLACILEHGVLVASVPVCKIACCLSAR